ncbi:SH3 domain-containing protein [bacterium]|nr:SH3 domain-containing protein [bacterium]
MQTISPTEMLSRHMRAAVIFLILCVSVPYGKAVTAQDFPERAPEALPGTTVEMNDPGYWIARIDDPDRVIMTDRQIGTFNSLNTSRSIGADHPYAKNIAQIEMDGPVLNRMNPLAAGDTFPGSTVRERLEQNNERLMKTTLYDRWELPLTEGKKTEIQSAVNLGSVPDTIRPIKGIIVRHTSARLYPTAEPGYRMRGYLDDINVTSLDMGMPVAVLHFSQKRDFQFVMSPIAWGWVPSADIAYGDEKAVRAFGAGGEFIVVIDHKAPLYADEKCSIFLGSVYMGERLTVRGKTDSGFRVSIPVRKPDGSLMTGEGWVRRDGSVHEGFLPYTKRNAITTAFRLLGRPYGWHDSWDERDCGGIMRVIFQCFGIDLPRYWSFQQLCTDQAVFVGDMKDMAEKNRRLGEMPAGITFTGSTGHIGLYLGSVDGRPFVIHECGWNYKEGDKELKMARVVVSDYEHIGFNMDGIKFFSPIMP